MTQCHCLALLSRSHTCYCCFVSEFAQQMVTVRSITWSHTRFFVSLPCYRYNCSTTDLNLFDWGILFSSVTRKGIILPPCFCKCFDRFVIHFVILDPVYIQWWNLFSGFFKLQKLKFKPPLIKTFALLCQFFALF